MKSKEIRNKWIDFFKEKNHFFLESKSLIPINDDSLLWINSGVATLKDYFFGNKKPPSKRLVSSQKSIRTNDIENIGLTSRHHTFFEMLGNFSIGDYFKEDAIKLAWEFLTSSKWLNLDKNKIFITYFNEDVETKILWKKITDISDSKLIPMGRKTNFWDIGNGPCGPATEIFFDRGEKFSKKGKELIENNIENDRYIEIWNIVFSEYNNLGNNKYEKLIQKNIDTGAGIERIACILQNGLTNFDTDLFLPIIKDIEKYSEYKYDDSEYFKENKNISKSFKIISDHIKAIVFTLGDGERPSNTNRGYVIRRLIRRSLVEAHIHLKVKLNGAFLLNLVDSVIKIYGEIYLEIKLNEKKIKQILEQEEKAFILILKTADELILKNIKNFDEKKAFNLFETHGIPYEIIEKIARKNKIKIDKNKFEKLLIAHQDIARENYKKNKKLEIENINLKDYDNLNTKFIGYDKLETSANIIGLIVNNKKVKKIDSDGIIILDRTTLFPTSGGQLHDLGKIVSTTTGATFVIDDITKHKNGAILHNVKLINGHLKLNETVKTITDKKNRLLTSINHSSVHLLFYLLESKFKTKIPQFGAHYNNDKFRFDFIYNVENINMSELKSFLTLELNKLIALNLHQKTIEMDLEDAKKTGAGFLEDEEYQQRVRVVKFGNTISDLCGGTHILKTSTIEEGLITQLEKKGSNTFRVEGVTTKNSCNNWILKEKKKWEFELKPIMLKYKALGKKEDNLERILGKFKKSKDINEMSNLFWEFQHDFKKLSSKLEEDKINKYLKNMELINPLIFNEKKYYEFEIENVDFNVLKKIYINLINNLNDEILIIKAISNNQILYILGINKLKSKINIIESINNLRGNFNFKGGGSNSMAQLIFEKKTDNNFKNELLKII